MWKDIDLSNGTIKIVRTVQRIYKNKSLTFISVDTPKTKNSIRVIPISSKIIKFIKLIKLINNYNGDDFFLTGNKKFIEPRTYQYHFKKVLKSIDLPNYKFHTLRHTFATNCIDINMDIKSLSKILGHSNVSITLNIYVHSSLEKQRKYLDLLN